MSNLSRKFVAVLMLLWLPLSGGSALAASMAMQAQQGSCHQTVVQPDDMSMHHHDAAPEQLAPDEHAASSCDSCGICHLACSGYLAVPDIAAPTAPQAAAAMTPYLVSFHSVVSTPLLPPPLVSA
ncbi:MAG: DUF2946 domain-containing protein [Gallionella sp.]|nr:DUF2946 domain-containing protein [Gallionella sp.]